MAQPFLTFEVIVKGGFDTSDLDLITETDLELAAQTGLAQLKLRIQEGIRADGKPFKPYSEKSIYIPLSGVGTGNPLVKPRGGRVTRGRGKGAAPKTMHFPDGEGYRAFRDLSGRGSNPVNFTLSGNTANKRFRVIKRTKTVAVIGWPAGSEQALAAAGLDAREDGRAFAWSISERDTIIEALRESMVANLAKAGVPVAPGDVSIQPFDRGK